MKQLAFLFILAVLSISCNQKNDSQDSYDDIDSAIAIETPSIDTKASKEFIQLSLEYKNRKQKELEAVGLPKSLWDIDSNLLNNLIHTKREKQGDISASGYKYKFRYGSPGNYTRNYNVEGNDENGNAVTGNVDVHEKYGSGTITNSDGNEKDIEVEWVDLGEMIGEDEDGVSYELRVQ